jgi:hypothetical protein
VATSVGSIKGNIGIESNYTQEYTITFTFIETSSAQNYNQSKAFNGVININSSLQSFTLKGKVIDSSSAPVANATIEIHSNVRTTTTDSKGNFTIEGIEVGSHEILVKDSGNTTIATDSISLLSGEETSVSNKTITANKDNSVVLVQIELGSSNINTLTSKTSTLTNMILTDNTAYADNVASPYVTASTGIDFSNISSDINGKGLYYTTDTLKTENGTRVYYYRGAVTNNYVIFGGFCWKIIRTNEDGSVKLFYWGTPTDNTCSSTASAPSSLLSIKFNTIYNDSAYAGYMYGNTNNFEEEESSVQSLLVIGASSSYYYGSSYTYDSITHKYTLSGSTINGVWNTSTICTSATCPVATNYQYTCKSTNSSDTCSTLYVIKSWGSATSANVTIRTYGSTSYNDAHENVNDSTIKTAIDTWYQTNINNQGTSITNLIANTPYCNDRSITDTTYNLGYGANRTIYSTSSRLNTIATPQYKCSQNNDKFTLSVASGGTLGYGNNALTYPVGLITADEAAYAGGNFSYINSTFYLYTNSYYWTMSPSVWYSTSVYAWLIYSYGFFYIDGVSGSFNVFPSISLASSTTTSTGDGTNTTPYIISTSN